MSNIFNPDVSAETPAGPFPCQASLRESYHFGTAGEASPALSVSRPAASHLYDAAGRETLIAGLASPAVPKWYDSLKEAWHGNGPAGVSAETSGLKIFDMMSGVFYIGRVKV